MAGDRLLPEENIMDAADLRSRVVSLEHKHAAHDQRFSSIEQRLAQADIADARKDEQFKSLIEKLGMTNEKIDGVKTDLHAKMDSLGGSIRWVGGLIIAASVTALTGAVWVFIIKGGLNVP
jgi:uncharacterized coiled-coil protein SlyX